MELHYESCLNLPQEPLLTSLLALLADVFKNQPPAELRTEITYQQTRTGLHTLLAVANDQVIACKLGYERKPGHFYSWLGAVHPDFRGLGIASDLMRQQHDWCRQQGYHTIRTQTYNQWRSMLILNLRQGFDVIGTIAGKYGLIIVLEKKV